MKTRDALTLLLPALFLSCQACVPWKGARFQGEKEQAVPFRAGESLEIRTVNGSVQVEPGGKDRAVLLARFRMTSRERLRQVRITAARKAPGTLEVRVAWPGGKRMAAEGCSLEIRIPPARGVLVRTTNGPITLEGMEGKADLESTNGALRVTRQGGPLRGRTTNGGVTLEKIRGGVDVETTNGPITLEGITGPVKARTTNGPIRVELDPADPGPLEARTTNGPMRIQVGPAFRGVVEMETTNGAIRVEGEHRGRITRPEPGVLRLFLGEGDAPSRLRTTNGTILFRVTPG